MRKETPNTPRLPVKELEDNNSETVQINVNPHDIPNDGHDEVEKQQIQVPDTSESHSRHTFHELTSHEPGIVAVHQLKSLW